MSLLRINRTYPSLSVEVVDGMMEDVIGRQILQEIRCSRQASRCNKQSGVAGRQVDVSGRQVLQMLVADTQVL